MVILDLTVKEYEAGEGRCLSPLLQAVSPFMTLGEGAVVSTDELAAAAG